MKRKNKYFFYYKTFIWSKLLNNIFYFFTNKKYFTDLNKQNFLAMSHFNAFDALGDDVEDSVIAAPVVEKKAATEKVIKKKVDDKKKNPKAKKAVEAKKPAEEQKPVRKNKREFDRVSGTGRGKELRKGGAGRFGAGNPKDPKTQETDEKPVEEKPVEKTEEELKKEQEEKEMAGMRTIEEYTKEQRAANKGQKMENLKVAAANEIAEDKACSKATVELKGKEEIEKKPAKKADRKKKAAAKPQQFVDFKFAEGRRTYEKAAPKTQKKPTAEDFPAL